MKKTTERLRKLEHEHRELKQILDLKLVPQREVEKFQKELRGLEEKIQEEYDRLESLKDQGEEEDGQMGKRAQLGAKPIYEATMPHIEAEHDEEVQESSFESTETYTMIDQSVFDIEQGDATVASESADEQDHDHWADGARWKRVADFERDAFEE